MNLRLVSYNTSPASASPYRLVDEQGRELAWANYFLDAQKVRQLSLRSLRAYAYDLLHLARWLQDTRHSLAKLNQSLLLDYVRRQLDHHPKPTPQTINHPLGVPVVQEQVRQSDKPSKWITSEEPTTRPVRVGSWTQGAGVYRKCPDLR